MKKILPFIITILALYLIIYGATNRDKNQITKNALEYFSNKYNINKKDIKIEKNKLYGPNKTCWNACTDNKLYIKYKDKKYYIEYHEKEDLYGDNYQYEEIYNDLKNYLNNRFSYASSITIDYLEDDITRTKSKYNGDIVEYMKNINRTTPNNIDEHGYTWITIMVKAVDENEAKTMYQKYSGNLVTGLNELKVNYNIGIAPREPKPKVETLEGISFYYYHVFDNYFQLYNGLEHQKYSCDRYSPEKGKCYY